MINVENSPLEYFEVFKLKNQAKRYVEDCNNKELRDVIREDLFFKQRGQCAYCERKITLENSTIEHISPRDKDHQLECEYSNLVLSCKSKDSCDRYKDSKVWEDRYIHPVLNEPTKYFEFSAKGYILGKNEDAQDTIELLNLNSDKLKRLRENIISYILPYSDLEDVEHENLIKQFGKKD